MLPEVEVEDESIIQREYVNLMKGREVARNVYAQRGQTEKENVCTAAGPGAPSAVGDTGRGVRRTDTEEVFN